jgi:hypothetical protein
VSKRLDPMLIEAAASDSWKTLWNGRPDKNLSMILAKSPEIFDMQKRTVEALLLNGCDVEKALRSLTRGKQGIADCSDDHRSFLTRLSAYLKAWAKAKNVPC